MSNEGDLGKRKVNIRIGIEVCRKVSVKYGRPEDNGDAVAFVRALEDATRGVSLKPEDYAAIAEEVQGNLESRMSKRKTGK